MSTQVHDKAVGRRVAWSSLGLSLLLSALNLAVAAASGSLAVAAEVVHHLVDLVAAGSVVAGLTISERKSRAFPYGLYKVENLVAVGLALLIFLSAYEIAQQALLTGPVQVRINLWVLAGVVVSVLLPGMFSIYEMRVGQALNSPSLIASAKEHRMHLFSSGLALLALAGQQMGLAIDRYAALPIVVIISKTGWELLANGMRVLLDASLDADTLERVRAVLQAEPAVTEVTSLVGRNAGRYRFLEAEVALRVDDLSKAHAISERIEAAVREQVPYVERLLLHYEPDVRTHRRYAVPLADTSGRLSQHFGEAPYFALVSVRTADGRMERQEVLPNPHRDVEKAKGIRVAEWLVGLKADVVLMRGDVQGKGPSYVFADAGVQIRQTAADTLAQALAEVNASTEGG